MKHILSIVLMSFAAVSIAQNTARLTISTTGTSNLKIAFANKKYSLPDRTATFQALTAGNYPITIFQLRKRQNGQMEYVAVYDRNITLSPNKHVEICVTRFGKVTLDEGAIEADDWNDGYTNPVPSDNDQSNGNGNWRNRDVVNTNQMNSIRNAINSEFSDDDKMRMAKVVLKNNLFTAVQLKELCNLFFSDTHKLEFAKFAYDYCFDKGSYYIVADVLFSTSNKRELLDYIGNK